VDIEPEREDADELLGNQARATGHALRPADGWAVVAKDGYLFSARGPQTCSIISHSMTRPASSRSELVMVPFGLESEITLAVTSGGHCKRETMGGQSESTPMIMPPTPWLDASTTPT